MSEKPNPVQFTETQFYEVNDAIAETVKRMITKGQTKTEVQYKSLAVLWSAWKQLVTASYGNWETPGMRDIAPKVEEAILHPKMLKTDHAD